MNLELESWLLRTLGAKSIVSVHTLQSLWSGYGSIFRVELEAENVSSVVVKAVTYPNKKSHPRGWQSDFAHSRKVKSYKNECLFYKKYGKLVSNKLKLPKYFNSLNTDKEVYLLLEDLTVEYPQLKKVLTINEVKSCILWLAKFHSAFMGKRFPELWQTGTYWHLQTRPDEWQAMQESDLKNKSTAIDQELNNCKYQTLLHGDAKVANFCFGESVAALDFQYVGKGCGMKDLAYFFSSCLTSNQCLEYESELLDFYFAELGPVHTNFFTLPSTIF